MDRESFLRLRGWVQHGAGLDLWRETHGGRESEWTDGLDAAQLQHRRDRVEAEAHGSVTYRPTAEQAQASPLLAACAARGMCEREVIDQLARENARLTVEVQTLADLMPPANVAAGLKRAQDIAAAWKALARAERAWAGAQSFGGVEARARAFQAVEVAKAALRALGVDPDAADEPGP